MTEPQITSQVHRASNVSSAPDVVEEVPTLMQVFEAIRSLNDGGVEPTRERIADVTRLKLTTIDDRIKVLRAEGMISAVKQCYRPTQVHAPARPVWVGRLPDGIVKVEVGDEVSTYTPAEAGAVGCALMGYATETTALAKVTELQEMLLRITAENRELGREVKALKAELKADKKQAAMAF